MKYFYLTCRWDFKITTTSDQSELGSNEGVRTPHALKLQDWDLTLRWFIVISKTLLAERESYLSEKMQSSCTITRGVVVIVVGNEHGDSSSNPVRDWLHFI